MAATDKFESWLKLDAAGLYCEAGGFYVDPSRAVPRAVITHGHSDHARPGHGTVLATPETIAVMKARLGPECAGSFQELHYGEPLSIGGVSLRLVPAGHILGSAQVVLEHGGRRAVVSGDYKRRHDPTATGSCPVDPRDCSRRSTPALRCPRSHG
jgi:putative mRNA 3-end processing factor